ncbi:MAG TPA: hypothetical protein VJ717_19700 [Gemmatimonadaceae bacterium]|nr:hypothetical protein [Gemmatimonadaceae bacterium]
MLSRFAQPLRIGVMAGITALAVACSDSAAPTAAPNERVKVLPSDSADAALLIPDSRIFASPDDPQLLAWFEREKLRIATALAASEASLELVNSQQTPTRTGAYSVLNCEPQPYVAATKIVGPLGATLSFGRHKLTVPPLAVPGWTVITAEAPASRVVRTTFAPHGLRFLLASDLTISYAHCLRPPTAVKRIVFVDNDMRFLENVRSSDDQTNKLVNGRIGHFSSYLIAY